jgi:hypothetical protein
MTSRQTGEPITDEGFREAVMMHGQRKLSLPAALIAYLLNSYIE